MLRRSLTPAPSMTGCGSTISATLRVLDVMPFPPSGASPPLRMTFRCPGRREVFSVSESSAPRRSSISGNRTYMEIRKEALPMRYKLLGKTGLRVSELCLGTMTFGEEWGWGASKEESRKIFDAYVDAGGNFVDTANLYTGGTSEKFVGEFLKGRRERFVLATKYTLNMRPDDPNGGGNHRKSLVQSLDASLKRLGTDYIDLYWVHAWDGMTPLEETMRALDDVVRAGKVLYVGISDAPAWIVSRANTLAELKNWTPFAALQIQYNLADRTPERDLLPMAKALDIAVTPWGVLAGGGVGRNGRHGRERADRGGGDPGGERGRAPRVPGGARLGPPAAVRGDRPDPRREDRRPTARQPWVPRFHPGTFATGETGCGQQGRPRVPARLPRACAAVCLRQNIPADRRPPGVTGVGGRDLHLPL